MRFPVMVLKWIKMIGFFLVAVVLMVFVVGWAVIRFSPQFGGSPSKSQVEAYKKSANYDGKVFLNTTPTSLDMDFGKMLSMSRKFFKGIPNGSPADDIPVQPLDSMTIVNQPDSLSKLTWFGHSTFLLSMDGKHVLIDPMLGDRPSPLPFGAGTRFNEELPISIEKLPAIDAVLISHDHYDHLDYGSIKKLKDKVGHFYVPFGNAAHMIRWGVDKDKITEHDWWQTSMIDSIQMTFVPSRHFSGRKMNNRFSTLWGGWVVLGDDTRIFFSGDSGYGPHFREIGERYGPFDFTMLECGQYNENWPDIHMVPEETVQASIDAQAKAMMPIHWGAFRLAMHEWNEPAQRATAKAKELGVHILTPKIGAPIHLYNLSPEPDYWWKEVK